MRSSRRGRGSRPPRSPPSLRGEGAREEALGMALAGALGLRTERCVTCAGAVVDYYKSGIYFSSDEMEMLRLYRGMDLPVREKLVGLLAAVYNADRKNGR